ncbi:hypothetical protein EAH87_16335 [Sphingomonas koreensis]|nr:hypothetical protein EAH87_16335 [Sphingomonas koreensis]
MKPTECPPPRAMSRARKLLEYSRSSLHDIAASVGHEDGVGLSCVFQHVVGPTPSDYRRRFFRT